MLAEGMPLRRGDLYLLCSDGLSSVLPDDTIRRTALDANPSEACARLIEFTLRADTPDNVTVGIATVDCIEKAAA